MNNYLLLSYYTTFFIRLLGNKIIFKKDKITRVTKRIYPLSYNLTQVVLYVYIYRKNKLNKNIFSSRIQIIRIKFKLETRSKTSNRVSRENWSIPADSYIGSSSPPPPPSLSTLCYVNATTRFISTSVQV